MCMHVSVWRYVREGARVEHGIPLELELQEVVSYLTWILRTKTPEEQQSLLTSEPSLRLLTNPML